MSSEAGTSNSQNKNETRLDESFKQNGTQSIEQSIKSSKVIQLESKLNGDQMKLNNKLGDNSAKNHLSSKASVTFANGTRSMQTNTCNFTNSTDQDINQDILNASVSPMFLNTNNIKSQTLNTAVTSQLKHKTVLSTSALNLPKPPMNLNLSSSQNNTHTNHCISGSFSTGTTSNATLYLNNSVPVSSTIQSNLSIAKPNEDIDMKNNVDYVSGIEKCPSKVSCSSDSSPEVDSVWASRSYGSNSLLNNIGGSIGSTSQGTCCFLRPNINGNKEVAGPSGLQKNTQREQNERRDSSSGNEGDMSDGEDYCIYTYKGNDDAVRLIQEEEVNQGQVEEREEEQCHSGRSSPEMDFLEMDFDPGPSCEQDTGDSDLASINEDIQNIALDNVDPDPVLNDLSSGKVVAKQGIASTSQNPKQSVQNVNNTETQQCSSSNSSVPEPSIKPNYPSPWMPSTSSAAGKWETNKIYRNTRCPLRESYGYHSTSGDLISPGDNRDSDAELWVESSSASVPENSNLNSRRVNLTSTLYHRMMAKKLMLNKQAAFNQSGDSNLENELSNERLDGLLPVEKIMLWSEQEATVKQVTQIGTSACGATAAINALLALNVPFSLETLIKSVNTRQREPGTPLPRYLYSRSVAGSTHRDLARGIALCTNGSVITKFFAFYPEKKVSLSHWLHYWISKGAAPIATLNLQHCGEGCDIPDAWHHQMIFGVGQAGIYLTNPLECLPEQYVWHQLVSPSILLVRRADVLAHWNPNTDLTPLAAMDQKWRKLNVFGQVVNMVREAMTQKRQLNNLTTGVTHIRIPASYQAGITLVMCADSAAASELLHTEQLPLL
ncbi:hypothetical protein E2986_06624 [Frieseomelitta varia]|uniref:Uncharacterized protein n=1 Tax=Frieseomelitta varia TaxID=561572 RepID=A0A833SEA6_9HYME|nr:uncharacterized protein LOC122538178 [Frieseomelitta varia]XP_043527955.1 uncharacterized protein LOC122538178 [Frieseomelitta varia]XP_043527956.1 uncharacterized protein LOC122538178 [Frieseomelitta varia]KAF3430206.1 hypothetical protein E2986_06624 [Frieseomelitta varia]